MYILYNYMYKGDNCLDKPSAHKGPPSSLDHAATCVIAITKRRRLGHSVPANRLAQMTPLDIFDAEFMDKSPSSFTRIGSVRSMFASRIPQATFFFSLPASPTPSHVIAFALMF